MAPKVHAQCFDATTHVSNVRRCIKEGHPLLIIMRGLPGSGKSYAARQLALINPECSKVFSTDDFFMVDGEYRFNNHLLSEYHAQNQKRAKDAMESGVKVVIIDNTNMKIEHFRCYILPALRLMYEVFILESAAPWAWKIGECARRNSHGVPKKAIEEMCNNYERVLNFQHLLQRMGYELRVLPSLLNSEESNSLLGDSPPSCSNDDSSDSRSENAGTLSALLMQDAACSAIEEVATKDVTDSFDLSTIKASIEPPPGFALKQREIMEPLFSLSPEPPQTSTEVSVRTVGTQARDSTTLLNLVKYFVEQDVFEEETSIYSRPITKVQFKDKYAQEETIVDDCDVLVTMFPEASPELLLHYYLLYGPVDTVQLMLDLNCTVEWEIEPVSGAFCYETTVASECFTSFHEIYLTPVIPSLPPTQTDPKKMYSPEVLDQMLEVRFGEDFIALLYLHLDAYKNIPSQSNPVQIRLLLYLYLASNGYEIERPNGEELMRIAAPNMPGLPSLDFEQTESAYLPIHHELAELLDTLFGQKYPNLGFGSPLPGWLIRTLYVALHSDHGEFAGSSTDSDEDLARRLQAEENGEVYLKTPKKRKKPPTMNQMLHLKSLKEDFPLVDENLISNLFYDNRCKVEFVRAMLVENFGPPSKKIDIVERPVNAEVPGFPTLKEAQDAAFVEREKARELRQRENLLRVKANRYRVNAHTRSISQHYINEANTIRAMAKKHEDLADSIISRYNEDAKGLDFHGLSIPAAMKALKDKLESSGRLSPQQKMTAKRKVRVVTGYGKTSGGKCPTKAAVQEYLTKNDYRYFMENPGEFVIFY